MGAHAAGKMHDTNSGHVPCHAFDDQRHDGWVGITCVIAYEDCRLARMIWDRQKMLCTSHLKRPYLNSKNEFAKLLQEVQMFLLGKGGV